MSTAPRPARVSLRGWSAVAGTALPRVAELVVRNLGQLAAVLSVVLLLAPSGPLGRGVGVGAGLLALGLAGLLLLRSWRRRASLLGLVSGSRLVLLVAAGALLVLRRPDEAGWVWVATGLGLASVLTESSLKASLTKTEPVAVHLPGIAEVPRPPFAPGLLAWASLAQVGVAAVLAALAAPGWLYLAVGVAVLGLTLLQLGCAARANLLATRAASGLKDALEAHAPAFAVYYAAVVGARYQLGMWLPYLERLGLPFVVITRNPATVATIASLTSAPIVVPRTSGSVGGLPDVAVRSLKAAFYVQGNPLNVSLMRFHHLTHCWLNHGDSDKAANFSAKHASYDRIFVCGQQGVDRYAAHRVAIDRRRFVLVGRPQIERIERRDEPPPPGGTRTVLYAPTWRGGRPATNYSSLPVAMRILDGLLARDVTVIFRPHPTSYRDDAEVIDRIQQRLARDAAATGRRHVYGDRAEREWDIPDCVNASDALVTDVSSVASDFLASGRPIAMVAVKAKGAAFRKEFAMARVSYVIERDMSTLGQALDDLLGADPLAAQRHAYRSYCLGDELGADAAAPFLRAAGRIVEGHPR